MLYRTILCLLSLLAFHSVKAVEANNPIAHPSAVIQLGNARFTVLTPEMIRIQYSDRQLFEDRATFGVINRRLPVPLFTTFQNDSIFVIKTNKLVLKYRIGEKISADSHNSLTITLNMNGKDVSWHPGLTDSLNLKGTTRTLDGNNGDDYKSRLENGLLSRGGWSIIDESPSFQHGDGSNVFAFDKNVDGMSWWANPIDPTAIDWYFLGYGHNYRQALTDFTKIAGKIPMPPLYILGYWYSKYQKYTAQDFMDIATEVEQHNIPLDVMIFDMDWHTEGWTGWTWNKEIIPDPKKLINFMHNKHLHVGLNLHPADGVDNDEDGFEQMVKDMHLSPMTTRIPWQLEDSTFYRVFFRDILRKHEALGVDFWWLDWQQNLTSQYTRGLGETFWCNHVFYNDMYLNRTDRRPVIFHRWGGLGSHRYPIGFSGDTYSNFETLAAQPYFTSTASNVCFGYWGHDLGGHLQNGANDPELYLRWMQYGVFTPIFRTHATNWEGIERRIWKYNNFPSLLKTVQLRYKLMPYIYGAAREAYDTGISICRPLYYDYPENENAYSQKSEYMFGDNILVAPIVARSKGGKVKKSIWLPEGLWYNVCTQKLMNGNQTFTSTYGLEDIPYFLKAGTVIPCYPAIKHLDKIPEILCLYAVCGANGTSSYYEDAGNDNGYENNQFFTQQYLLEDCSLTIMPIVGSYPNMTKTRSYEITFLACRQPKKVMVNDENLSAKDWQYNSKNNSLTLHIKKVKLDKKLVINLL